MGMPGQRGSDRSMTVTEVIEALTELTKEFDFNDQPVVIEDQYGAEAHITDIEIVNGIAFVWPSVDLEERS